MGPLESIAVVAVVLAAAAYVTRRAVRTLSGRSCGCGAPVGKGCPAARSLAGDLERLARGPRTRS